MSHNEPHARIKINKLLEQAGWRFFDDAHGDANIRLEAGARIVETDLDALGQNFDKTKQGKVDFLLLDERGFPLLVLEAKAEDKNPLVGKEQARKYARAKNCRFVILSNGNIHYFWDLERGNPYQISDFPAPASVKGYAAVKPDPQRLVNEPVGDDYIALTQNPTYRKAAAWQNEDERAGFIEREKLRFLRAYQKQAVQAIQREVAEGQDRFLFEMATGTGKTLTAAAVIKLFLRSGNARRVLFLVDRIELENQAERAFKALLGNDFTTVIYKERRDDWRHAEIVVTTVQSLLTDNKYRRLFSPTDFDLVISDEAHRSIGGNARAVFEYFVGYKLGLTATPKDYLKHIDDGALARRDPREYERRQMLDTYKTFGCASGEPTFRYSLIDGVRDGYLVNPYVVDARTDVTTQLLSDQGYAAQVENEEGDADETRHKKPDFERNFFSEPTNRAFCRIFLQHALRDPISGEIGKSILFAVSQDHAARLTQILNEEADALFPGSYQSDFAVQVTSIVDGAQQFAINFANNNLLGSANFNPAYRTSKARVCVTVGMMTTGYDCPDLLNLGLLRPIYSPTDFIQMKGRGTRRHTFTDNLFDDAQKQQFLSPVKTQFKLFDFFANCEYFEEDYDYDQVLKLPRPAARPPGDGPVAVPVYADEYEYVDPDALRSLNERQIGAEGMKIDRMFFEKFEEKVTADQFIKHAVLEGRWDDVVAYVNEQILDKPEEFYTLAKLNKAAGVDRRLLLREMIEKAYGLIPRFKTKDEILDEAFEAFLAAERPAEGEAIRAMRYYFKAYATDPFLRGTIDAGHLSDLNTHPAFTMQDYRAVPAAWRKAIPEYIKYYLPLNQFMQ